MPVTVTGGAGHDAVSLFYTAHDIAHMQAQALSATISQTYSSAIYYNPASPPATPSNGYLIVRPGGSASPINATGFGAIVDENDRGASTITGGGNDSGQIVLASKGGLSFTATSGNTTVVSGGGDNLITLTGDTGSSAIYTSTGNDTIHGGDGATTISAGGGDNTISLGAGASLVDASGYDTVSLGSGADTIDVLKGGHVLVTGAAFVAGPGFTLTFIGGAAAATVQGGAGSYDIQAGKGGGVFTGGSAGDNSIVGGFGAVTITGGGAGDTLMGGSGADSIVAGIGNETLGGGHGANVFDLQLHNAPGTAGDGTTDTIIDFGKHDLLDLGSQAADNYALNTFHVSGDTGVFMLQDGTKVVLDGFTHLSASNFKT